MKKFACASVVPGCGALFTGDSNGEVLLQAVDHADEEHGMTDTRAQVAVRVLDELADAA